MTVGNNDTNTIATHSDWLNRLAPIFQPLRSKTKTIAPYTRDFSRVLSKLQSIARISDWFLALFAPVMIGRSNYFGLLFSTVICKPLFFTCFIGSYVHVT